MSCKILSWKPDSVFYLKVLFTMKHSPIFTPVLFSHILCVNVYHFILSKNEGLAHSPVREWSHHAILWLIGTRNEERKEKEWKRLVNACIELWKLRLLFLCRGNLSIPHVWQWKLVCCSIAQRSVCKQEGKHHRDVGHDGKAKRGDILRKLAFTHAVCCCRLTLDYIV